MGRNPNRYSAVFGIITNEKGEVLLLKRQNTGYFDEGYIFPAGHIEDGETSDDAMIREVKEEVGIEVNREDIKPIAILNRITHAQFFDVCYFIENWSGEIKNAEPEKCSGTFWFNKDDLPEHMAPEMKIFLKHYFEFGKELRYYTLKR